MIYVKDRAICLVRPKLWVYAQEGNAIVHLCCYNKNTKN